MVGRHARGYKARLEPHVPMLRGLDGKASLHRTMGPAPYTCLSSPEKPPCQEATSERLERELEAWKAEARCAAQVIQYLEAQLQMASR